MSAQCDIIDLLRNEGKISEAAALEIVRLRSKLAAAESALEQERAKVAALQESNDNWMEGFKQAKSELAECQGDVETLQTAMNRVALLLCKWKTAKINGDELADKLFDVFASDAAIASENEGRKG